MAGRHRHDPVWKEASDAGVRGYVMPEDDKSVLYIYETELKQRVDDAEAQRGRAMVRGSQWPLVAATC
jgi:hypothetical protein